MSKKFPLRYDIVGSFLRPESLKLAGEKSAEGTMSSEEYQKLQNDAVADLVKKEEKAGLKAVTDGEFTRWAWHHDFIAALNGVEEMNLGSRTVFQGVEVKNIKAYRIVDTVGFPQDHPFLGHFAFLKSQCGEGITAKQTIPGPNMVHMGGVTNAETYKASPIHLNFDKVVSEISLVYQNAIQAFYDAGCRYLQLDDTAWAGLLEAGAREKYADAGVDIDEILEKFTYLTEQSIKNKPEGMALTFHMCRGNFQSSHLYEGTYENVASKLFSLDNFDGFFLEFDDERSGGFDVLRHIREQKVVLGLVTSKKPALEDEDFIIKRIREAAAIMPLEQLCLSPQCGFASTVHGNKLSEQDQWNKIALIKRIAEKVWDDA